MRVAVLGMGRLGSAATTLLRRAGREVLPWRRGEPVPEADVTWIVVRDDAIAAVAALVPRDRLVLHASGAHGPELLAGHPERGVLHPLMTFPGGAPPDTSGAVASVAGTAAAVAAARALAADLGLRPVEVAGDRRRYHAAACLASGHLAAAFLAAARVMESAGVGEAEARGMLFPLARESLQRVAAEGGAGITGPISRGDAGTEAAHRAALDGLEGEVYEVLARAIRRARGPEGGRPPG